MLRDKDVDVREKASFALVELERTDAIPDLVSAIRNEENSNCKKSMMLNLNKLKEISNQL